MLWKEKISNAMLGIGFSLMSYPRITPVFLFFFFFAHGILRETDPDKYQTKSQKNEFWKAVLMHSKDDENREYSLLVHVVISIATLCSCKTEKINKIFKGGSWSERDALLICIKIDV